MKANRKYDNDPRIRQARKHYKEHLTAGMDERTAWALFMLTQAWVLKELKRARVGR